MPFSGFGDLDPRFAQALQRFVAANPGLSPFSGYRSPERQAVLYANALKKYGSPEAARKWVAPPGRSYHGKGLAVDLKYADAAARQWAHQNAAQYGLAFPLGNEPWHIELAGARGGGHSHTPAALSAGLAEPQASQSGVAPGVPSPAPIGFLNSIMQQRFSPMAQAPQMTAPMSFGEMLLTGQNPLRSMYYNALGRLFS